MSISDPRPTEDPNEAFPQLREERLSGEQVYPGNLLKVHRDWVRGPDGHEQAFEYTLHPGAAAIVALTAVGKVVLERQWRYALNRSFLEVPAGKLSPGEDPFLAARRELQEETGYTAGQWARLGVMHPVIGYSTEAIYLFMAKDLVLGQSAREPGECLELIELTPAELMAAIHRGEVTDSKTLSCALWLDQVLRGEWQPQWQACPA